MIAKGIGNCFAFGKCFRNLEGAGSLHLPEFLMFEWYREDAEYQQIMTDVKKLILEINQQVINRISGGDKAADRDLGIPIREDPDARRDRQMACRPTQAPNTITYGNKTISLEGEWPVFSMVELFQRYAGLDFVEMLDDEKLFQRAKEKGYSTDGALWSELFDQIFCNEIEPQMPLTPFFINDFPARLSPLCKVQKDKPYLADRFEFFIFGMELANGNNENTDYQRIRRHMEQEQEARAKKYISVQNQCNQSAHANNPDSDFPISATHETLKSPNQCSIDEEFINALKTMDETGKCYAGIGLGIDRLAMIMADVERIEEVELLHV